MSKCAEEAVVMGLWDVLLDVAVGKISVGAGHQRILEGFDVTPKPVISEQELGRMVRSMADDINHPAVSSVSLGADLRDALDRRGLEIVRKKGGE